MTGADVTPPPVRFTALEAERAFNAWGCNCGPGALAAVFGFTLEQVRPYIPGFILKRYTNPTMMFDALDGIGAPWKCTARGKRNPTVDWPRFGLARVQWEGPWTAPNVPIAARYRHTHWVGACRRDARLGIFDINCINNGSGWVGIDEWRTILVPWLLRECEPGASGAWHLTHSIEIGPRA